MVFQRHIFCNPFYLFFFFFFTGSNQCNQNFFRRFRKTTAWRKWHKQLVATHELESFAIKYGKTHLTANERAVTVQKLFGEFFLFFVFYLFIYFFIFQLNIYKFTSSFIFKVTLIYARCLRSQGKMNNIWP